MAGKGEVTLRVDLDAFDEAVLEAIEGMPDEKFDRFVERLERRMAQRARQRGVLRIP